MSVTLPDEPQKQIQTINNTVFKTIYTTLTTASLKQAAIFSVVSIALAGLAIYVMYAGNVHGPGQLWNLSSHTLHLNAAIIAGSGGGLAAIAMITTLARRALNIYDAKKTPIILSEQEEYAPDAALPSGSH